LFQKTLFPGLNSLLDHPITPLMTCSWSRCLSDLLHMSLNSLAVARIVKL